MVILGSMSLLGSFLTLMLPETLHKQLPDTVQQAEHIHHQNDINDTADDTDIPLHHEQSDKESNVV